MVTLINIFMDAFTNNLLFREKRGKKRLEREILKEKWKKRRSGVPGYAYRQMIQRPKKCETAQTIQ